MTVLEVIQKSTAFLEQRGVDSPRLQSESILAHVLRSPRMQLYLDFQRELSENQVETCRRLVQRRGAREPLQHLVGSVSFAGLEIRVNAHALIPRPETEQLVDHARRLLASVPLASPRILDFGTGSGCIAVALAVHEPRARIVALDCSAEALELARENVRAHRVLDRVELLCGNGFAVLRNLPRFHLIVSNPPYIPTAEIDFLQPEVRDHDPRIALDGGRDGLDFYRWMAVEAPACLLPGGALLVEMGDGQASATRALLEDEKWVVEDPIADYSDTARFLVARPPTKARSPRIGREAGAN